MGILRIVSTPIGNLEDISQRALRVLKESDFILCEDTRVSHKLLEHYKIKTPTLSYHQHSNNNKIDKIIELLEDDKELSLITDAGTPALSDPGAKLISLLREKIPLNLKIESIPGPSALTATLAIAGLGFEHFLFLGFLPNKKGRQSKLKEIFKSDYPIIIYESKHRIIKLMEELKEMSLSLNINLDLRIARELTKLHESFYQGKVGDILDDLLSSPSNLKGEFVVLIKKDKVKKNRTKNKFKNQID